MRDIGKNIKSIRQNKAMTQDELANALFVTRQTISNYENGRTRPDLDMLIQIAEVLETDVNTVIYGPTVPEIKKSACKWAVRAVIALAVTWIIYIVIIVAFPAKGYAGYIYSIRLINKETFMPLGMFLLGWSLLHGLSLCTGLRQLEKEKAKVGRIVLLVIGGVAALVPVPYNIWLGVAAMRSYAYGSVSMAFPYVPVYQQTFQGIIYVIHHLPFLYTILGGLMWLFRIPDTKRESNS